MNKLFTALNNLRWKLRNKTWPMRVWLVNLSWIPLWWLRKHPSRIDVRWTPAATIRHMSQHIQYLRKKNREYLDGWGKCEMELRAERMARVSDAMTQKQKNWSREKMGVDFKGSETN